MTDGLSNTLAVGEFVEIDMTGSAATFPGNMAPWICGDNGQLGSYSFKVITQPINAQVNGPPTSP